jgi:replicative DNA helicase
MKVVVFEERAYFEMLAEMKSIIKEAVEQSKESIWVDSKEAANILGIKSRTKMLQLRKEGQIIYSKHGRIIKYKRQSLYDFLDQNASL